MDKVKLSKLDKTYITAHGRIFRCDVCGKFISYKEIDDDEVENKFTPDSEFTIEETLFTHKKCLK